VRSVQLQLDMIAPSREIVGAEHPRITLGGT
jgi:hypothetical protein